MNTFSETEALLKSAIILSQNSVKKIGEISGIKPSTLYKWKTTDVHLSPQKADALLIYFIENEPQAIIAAYALNYVLLKLYIYLTSSTEVSEPAAPVAVPVEVPAEENVYEAAPAEPDHTVEKPHATALDPDDSNDPGPTD